MVEADAIKYRDAVYQQLNRSLRRSGTSTADISKYVHEYSTKAAESLFVTAINQQRVRPRAALPPPIPASSPHQKNTCSGGHTPASCWGSSLFGARASEFMRPYQRLRSRLRKICHPHL